MSWDRTNISFAIFIGSLLLFVPFLGMSHLFDWDEANFAEAAREMLVTGEFTYVQIDFKPFWEKPPFFIWLQALSMKAFGINEFAARFPNAICGALTLTVLFNIGNILKSKSFGLLWVLVYAGSMLPQFYFRTGIIDPWFNLFIFLGIHQLIIGTKAELIQRKNLVLSAVFIGLAVLTKGPTALGIIGICCAVYFAFNFKNHSWKITDAILYSVTVLIIGFSWFLIEFLRGRGYIIQEFIDYHVRLFAEGESGHGQPFYYHPIVLLIGCFPMSLFFIYGWFQKRADDEAIDHYSKWMSILFWVVLIVFSIVKTKIIHYSSLSYFPMSFLATLVVYRLLEGRWKFKPTHQISTLLFIAILGSAFVLLGMLHNLKEPLLELLKNDPLAYGNFSQTVPDGTFDPFIGIFFLFAGMCSVVLIQLGKSKSGIIGLFGTTLITITLLSIFIAPKIDRYTQTALFDFYEEKSNAAYIQPLSFRTYAHLFYSGKQPTVIPDNDELHWLLTAKVDKPVYFILRPQNLENNLNWFPNLEEVDRKGGYVIMERTDSNYPF